MDTILLYGLLYSVLYLFPFVFWHSPFLHLFSVLFWSNSGVAPPVSLFFFLTFHWQLHCTNTWSSLIPPCPDGSPSLVHFPPCSLVALIPPMFFIFSCCFWYLPLLMPLFIFPALLWCFSFIFSFFPYIPNWLAHCLSLRT